MRKALLLILLLVCTKVSAQDRILGADLSLLPAYEAAGTEYYPQTGSKIEDVVAYVRDEAGMNAVRVRLFVGPDGSDPAVCQTLDYVKVLGKRVKDAGMKLLLDFHYSDTWADPSSQSIPQGWRYSDNPDEITDWSMQDSVYKYTVRCLKVMKEYGAAPDYVQMGNEISYGMLWRAEYDKVYPALTRKERDWQWERLGKLIGAGAKAVREEVSGAKVIVHTERVAETEATVNFYSYLDTLGVDYDIVGLSFYPFYHGDLMQLSQTLEALKTAMPSREVHIVETAYVYSNYPSDAEYDLTKTWPATVAGQQKYVEDLTQELWKHSNVTGLYWWFAEENGNGKSKTVISRWLNRGLWNNTNNKALPALYKLQNFLSVPTSIMKVRPKTVQKTGDVFDMSGRKTKVRGRGIYIGGGVGFVVR